MCRMRHTCNAECAARIHGLRVLLGAVTCKYECITPNSFDSSSFLILIFVFLFTLRVSARWHYFSTLRKHFTRATTHDFFSFSTSISVTFHVWNMCVGWKCIECDLELHFSHAYTRPINAFVVVRKMNREHRDVLFHIGIALRYAPNLCHFSTLVVV